MTATPNGEPKAPEENTPFVETAPSTAENGTENTEPEGPNTTMTEKSEAPAKSAAKGEWVAYAESLGIDSSGTVKEIQERIDNADDPHLSEDGDSEEILLGLQGEHLPISFVSGNLLGEVKVNAAGIRVLNVGIVGMIGVEPASVVLEEADDFDKLLSGLRQIAREKLAQ